MPKMKLRDQVIEISAWHKNQLNTTHIFSLILDFLVIIFWQTLQMKETKLENKYQTNRCYFCTLIRELIEIWKLFIVLKFKQINYICCTLHCSSKTWNMALSKITAAACFLVNVFHWKVNGELNWENCN